MKNKRLKAAPVIGPFEDVVAQRYEAYVAHCGNPWGISADTQFQPPKASFHALYNSPPKALEFIAALRDLPIGACPMCGSDGTGTLDHYLPKSEYPEFSFLSLNLVPSCFRCNTLRKAKYVGITIEERPVHPYYDDLANERVLTAQVSGPYTVPAFTAVPWNVPPLKSELVAWHIQNIVEPAGFSNHCQHAWVRLIDKPSLYLGQEATQLAVRDNLVARSQEAAHFNESENSWNSCFFHGVSENPAAIAHLTSTLAADLLATQS